jgi:hypothetical protein
MDVNPLLLHGFEQTAAVRASQPALSTTPREHSLLRALHGYVQRGPLTTRRGQRLSPTTAGFAELTETCVNVQLRGDRRGALHFVDERVHAGHSVADIRQRVIAAAQREIAINRIRDALRKAGVGVTPSQAHRS